MTQELLRELLRERVAHESMPDLSGPAWRDGRRVRRRRRLGVVAGVAAATVGLSVGIAAVDSSPPAVVPPSSRPVPAVAAPGATPDATYEGVPVWWSPDQQEEQTLPSLDASVDSPLPADIDLAAARPLVPGELDRAVAAFARARSVVLVGSDGEVRTVDLSGLQKVTTPNGYSYFPTDTHMLTSNGEWLVFRQPGQKYALFTIATGEWSTVDSFSDDADSGPIDPPFDVSAAQPYGMNRDSAQSYGMGVPLPVRNASTYVTNPEFLLADDAVLVFMGLQTDGQDSRYKDCCPVAGRLGQGIVVYESRQTHPLLVAWKVGTHEFSLVSRINRAYDVASFALGR